MGAARVFNKPRIGRWIPGILAVVSTFALLWLLSPGLRSDLGQLAVLLGELNAADMKDWFLSFGAFSPVVYFLIMVGQVIASPIPAGPVTLAGALLFGVWEGLALSMAGSVVGSVLVFAMLKARPAPPPRASRRPPARTPARPKSERPSSCEHRHP